MVVRGKCHCTVSSHCIFGAHAFCNKRFASAYNFLRALDTVVITWRRAAPWARMS